MGRDRTNQTPGHVNVKREGQPVGKTVSRAESRFIRKRGRGVQPKQGLLKARGSREQERNQRIAEQTEWIEWKKGPVDFKRPGAGKKRKLGITRRRTKGSGKLLGGEIQRGGEGEVVTGNEQNFIRIEGDLGH